jgi:cytochrome b
MANQRMSLKVWDPIVRIGHWTLALTIAGAWLTRNGSGALHEWIGYASLAVVALRVAYGWLGPARARFDDFVRSPAATLSYAAAMVRGREPRYIGHNPLGGWMVIALLINAALAGLSGWLYTTDRFWGDPRMESLHNALAISLLVLAGLHVAGVIATSWRHRENLVAAMVHGRKRPPAGNDVGL